DPARAVPARIGLGRSAGAARAPPDLLGGNSARRCPDRHGSGAARDRAAPRPRARLGARGPRDRPARTRLAGRDGHRGGWGSRRLAAAVSEARPAADLPTQPAARMPSRRAVGVHRTKVPGPDRALTPSDAQRYGGRRTLAPG